ncbi:MAG: hypothetical protein V1914_00665 [archaeon]
MVRLQESKGKYSLIVPLDKIKRKGFQKGQEFDVQWSTEGNLEFVPM